MDAKECFKCTRALPRSEFYAHPRMADGLLGKCKDCTKSDVKRRYYDKHEEVAKYERERFRSPSRKANVLKYQATARARNPEKTVARQAVSSAIRCGRLTRQPCQRCGTTEKVQAHHHDYSKPLVVEWLCFKHHREDGHGQITSQPAPPSREPL